MNPYKLSRSAILRIIEGLISEVDKVHGLQLKGFQSDVTWDEAMSLGENGLGIAEAQMPLCHQVLAEFFNLEVVDFTTLTSTVPLGKWVGFIAARLHDSMSQFHFRPAGYNTGGELCTHRVDNLFQEAASVASLLQGRRRLVSLVSPHSVMGLVVGILVPGLLQIDVIDARKKSPEQLMAVLSFGDVIVATPTLWSYLMREGVKVPDNSMGVSFGEVMTMDLAAKMRRNGVGVLREFYGSTQSGLVAWRDSPNDDFVLFDNWSKAEQETDGLIRLYSDFQKNLIKPMDYFNWKNSRTFSLNGRRDGAVQIGAINVFPNQIAETLMDYKAIDQCTVRVASTRGGTNRLVADIYLSDRQQADEITAREIDNWCRMHLAVHERPHILNFYVKS